MTPAARLSAAAHILDQILAGHSAEQVLTNWGRANRFAGSGDRAALRDLVFDALRCKRSFAALGGAETGRGLMIGNLRAQGIDPDLLFTGVNHAPAPVTPDEMPRAPSHLAALDCPDWLAPRLQSSLGAEFEPVMLAMRRRAPVFLRVNMRKGSVAQAIAEMAVDGVIAKARPDVANALEVTENPRKIQTSAAYLSGLVELQDLSSQAVVEALPLRDGMCVLDYCAGGGGKTLALAARAKIQIDAHDVSPARMRDLPTRAARAGVKVNIINTLDKTSHYDLVLTDAPCSGSGSWRRDPQGKWALTEERLQDVQRVQSMILDEASRLVAPKGHLAYVTCSLLVDENAGQVQRFLDRHPAWSLGSQRSFTPIGGGDGFFVATLTKN